MIKKALIVGVDDYPEIPLKGCVNDARKLSELLKTNGDGSPNFDVAFVPNVKTKNEMYELLDELFNKGKVEVALLYFSGHGSEDLDGRIVLPDFAGRDIGIPMSEIIKYANKSKSNNKIIILDCCFSGKLGEGGMSGSTDSILSEGVTIMTASNRDEAAFEDPSTGHGVFTNLLIQGLKGGAADIGGNITPASLYSFVDQSLGGWDQRPLFKTNIARFLPIRTVQPKVPKETLRKIRDYFESPNMEFQLDPSFEYTNTLNYKHELKEPYAIDKNVGIFKDLQLYQSVGLVEPVEEEHMYFAAMKNKTCRLTPIGQHYWKLSKDQRF